jgi:hypothetical protein
MDKNQIRRENIIHPRNLSYGNAVANLCKNEDVLRTSCIKFPSLDRNQLKRIRRVQESDYLRYKRLGITQLMAQNKNKKLKF